MTEPVQPPRISMAELQRLMRDPEIPESQLQAYFMASPHRSGPFDPGIVPDPEVVDIAPAADELEGAMMMNWASSLTRQRRQLDFQWRQLRGDKRPVLVAEGDSWFNFPILLADIVDQLSNDYSIWSVDAPGDTLQNMVIDQPEYMRALQSQRKSVKAFLFSGAGNDILGEDDAGVPILPKILRKFSAGKPADWYIGGAAFAEKLKFIEDCYSKVIRTVSAAFPKLPIICHSYDFAIPGGFRGDPRKPSYAAQDGWIGRPMREALGIHDPALQRQIVAAMIARLSEVISGLCGGNRQGGTFANAWYVPTPSTLPNVSLWNDELHPTDIGYALVTDKFRSVLSAALGGFESSAQPEAEVEEFEAGQAHVCAMGGAGEDEGFEAAARPVISRSAPSPHKEPRGNVRIDHIVMHYTTSRNIEGSISHFKSGRPRTSCHYLIGRDGELVQVVPEDECAWHAGSKAMNRRSIGIEHVAAPGDEITPAQASTSAALIAWLMRSYAIPRENVIPHSLIKPTACCGDLFRAYGGGSKKSAQVQNAALQQWLAGQGIGGDEAPSPVLAAPAASMRQAERQRHEMAQLILDFEAKRDAEGRLAVHRLAPQDGGGRYEVAGINERYHKADCDRLVRLVEAGRFDEAESAARSFILAYTARAAGWTNVPAIELCLRDAMFNRGPGGAGRILQRALGVAVDGAVGAVTKGALVKAEADPCALLSKLRAAREWYERVYARRDETSPFWRGLVSRWNRLDKAAAALLVPGPDGGSGLEAAPLVSGSLEAEAPPLAGLVPTGTASAVALPFIQAAIGRVPFAEIGDKGPLDDPAGMLNGWRAKRYGISKDQFERQVGRDDSLPASFLDALSRARGAVGRISARGIDYAGQNGRWTGTGFLVAPDILLTNNHVLNSIEVARSARIEFDFEISSDELEKGLAEPQAGLSRIAHPLDPDRLFLTSPARGGLDYTFVGVSLPAAEERRFIPVRRAAFAIAEEEKAFIIHHPDGRGKRVSLDDVAVIGVSSSVVHYTSDTLAGSSGAPVFDRRGRLFGLHHKGIAQGRTLPDGRIVDGMNEAVKMAAIAMDLEARHVGGEARAVETVLARIEGSDSMAGFFGNLGREAMLPKVQAAEAAARGYLSSWLDVDAGFLDLGGKPLAPEQVKEVATCIIDLGGDLWVLRGTDAEDGARIQARIAAEFSQHLGLLAAPDGSGQVVLWNPREVEASPIDWPQSLARYWSLEPEAGKRLFAASPALYRIRAAESGAAMRLVPLADGALDHPLAMTALLRAISEVDSTDDWLVGPVPQVRAPAGIEALSAAPASVLTEMLTAFEPQGEGLIYLRKDGSAVRRLHVPRDLAMVSDPAKVVIAGDRSARAAAEALPAGAPLLVRLSTAEAAARPQQQAGLAADLDLLLGRKA